MAKDDEPIDDLHPVTWARLTETPADLPTEAPVGRLDYGDAAQRAEMDGIDEVPPDEPVEMVDAPIQIREPFSRVDKQRNQRRLPT